MKLQKFIKNKKQKQILIGTIIGIIILIGGITLYHTFAMYKTEKSFDVIKGIIPDFRIGHGNITLAYTIDGSTSSNTFPNRQDGYLVESVICENNVQAEWDNISWSLKNIKNKQKSSKISCTVNFNRSSIYKEAILNGADPVLKDNLIPVKIDNQGKVKKANIKEQWYKYEDKQWANAVILKEGVETPEDNAEIKEEDIESYFVWIPKYRYKIFDSNIGNYTAVGNTDYSKANRPIEIEFGLTNTINDDSNPNYMECATPMLDNKVQGVSGGNGSCAINKWMTHPAFLAFNTNGIWVGKFGVGNVNDQIQIKPDTNLWLQLTVKDSFIKGRDYKTELLSHMMKNTEWGAVTYLTHSQYGICTTDENQTTKCTEISSSDRYIAGKATVTYFNDSTASSTTSNYSGIFGMSGGSIEQQASLMFNSNNQTIYYGSSGLTDDLLTDKRYYDVYKYGASMDHWERRILGDATGELGGFYTSGGYGLSGINGDEAEFVNISYPWFYRGGSSWYGTRAGIYSFGLNKYDSETPTVINFRIVLAPQ